MPNNKNNLQKHFSYHLDYEGIPATEASKRIHEELEEDGLTSHDLGSYTTIKMLPEADSLIHQSIGKNMVNQNEYQKTTGIHENMIKTIAQFLHAPNIDKVFGSSTTGSSEAIFLAILAAKWRWKNNKTSGQPNIIFCSNAHLCWHKFAKYLDIETREISLEEIGNYPIDKVIKKADSNTICIVAVLGCTHLGSCDPIHDLNQKLEDINLKNNWDIGIHVDAAIGGFIFPFLDQSISEYWDFQLSLVRSINLSGHKFGLVYPGLGWVLFKDKSYFQSNLSLKSNYLCGISESFTVNFSRSSSLVIAQYFNFLHYGFEGYQKIIEKSIDNAAFLSQLLENTGLFQIISDGKIPVVVFRFNESKQVDINKFTQLLRQKQWMLPYYKLSGQIDITVMRVVIRNDIKKSFLQQLVYDLVNCHNTLITNHKNN